MVNNNTDKKTSKVVATTYITVKKSYRAAKHSNNKLYLYTYIQQQEYKKHERELL